MHNFIKRIAVIPVVLGMMLGHVTDIVANAEEATVDPLTYTSPYNDRSFDGYRVSVQNLELVSPIEANSYTEEDFWDIQRDHLKETVMSHLPSGSNPAIYLVNEPEDDPDYDASKTMVIPDIEAATIDGLGYQLSAPEIISWSTLGTDYFDKDKNFDKTLGTIISKLHSYEDVKAEANSTINKGNFLFNYKCYLFSLARVNKLDTLMDEANPYQLLFHMYMLCNITGIGPSSLNTFIASIKGAEAITNVPVVCIESLAGYSFTTIGANTLLTLGQWMSLSTFNKDADSAEITKILYKDKYSTSNPVDMYSEMLTNLSKLGKKPEKFTKRGSLSATSAGLVSKGDESFAITEDAKWVAKIGVRPSEAFAKNECMGIDGYSGYNILYLTGIDTADTFMMNANASMEDGKVQHTLTATTSEIGIEQDKKYNVTLQIYTTDLTPLDMKNVYIIDNNVDEVTDFTFNKKYERFEGTFNSMQLLDLLYGSGIKIKSHVDTSTVIENSKLIYKYKVTIKELGISSTCKSATLYQLCDTEDTSYARSVINIGYDDPYLSNSYDTYVENTLNMDLIHSLKDCYGDLEFTAKYSVNGGLAFNIITSAQNKRLGDNDCFYKYLYLFSELDHFTTAPIYNEEISKFNDDSLYFPVNTGDTSTGKAHVLIDIKFKSGHSTFSVGKLDLYFIHSNIDEEETSVETVKMAFNAPEVYHVETVTLAYNAPGSSDSSVTVTGNRTHTTVDEIGDMQYISNPNTAFAQIKEGSPWREEYEAMSGVPTDRSLYISAGGTEYVIDVKLKAYKADAIRKFQANAYPTWCKQSFEYRAHVLKNVDSSISCLVTDDFIVSGGYGGGEFPVKQVCHGRTASTPIMSTAFLSQVTGRGIAVNENPNVNGDHTYDSSSVTVGATCSHSTITIGSGDDAYTKCVSFSPCVADTDAPPLHIYHLGNVINEGKADKTAVLTCTVVYEVKYCGTSCSADVSCGKTCPGVNRFKQNSGISHEKFGWAGSYYSSTGGRNILDTVKDPTHFDNLYPGALGGGGGNGGETVTWTAFGETHTATTQSHDAGGYAGDEFMHWSCSSSWVPWFHCSICCGQLHKSCNPHLQSAWNEEWKAVMPVAWAEIADLRVYQFTNNLSTVNNVVDKPGTYQLSWSQSYSPHIYVYKGRQVRSPSQLATGGRLRYFWHPEAGDVVDMLQYQFCGNVPGSPYTYQGDHADGLFDMGYSTLGHAVNGHMSTCDDCGGNYIAKTRQAFFDYYVGSWETDISGRNATIVNNNGDAVPVTFDEVAKQDTASGLNTGYTFGGTVLSDFIVIDGAAGLQPVFYHEASLMSVTSGGGSGAESSGNMVSLPKAVGMFEPQSSSHDAKEPRMGIWNFASSDVSQIGISGNVSEAPWNSSVAKTAFDDYKNLSADGITVAGYLGNQDGKSVNDILGTSFGGGFAKGSIHTTADTFVPSNCIFNLDPTFFKSRGSFYASNGQQKIVATNKDRKPVLTTTIPLEINDAALNQKYSPGDSINYYRRLDALSTGTDIAGRTLANIRMTAYNGSPINVNNVLIAQCKYNNEGSYPEGKLNDIVIYDPVAVRKRNGHFSELQPGTSGFVESRIGDMGNAYRIDYNVDGDGVLYAPNCGVVQTADLPPAQSLKTCVDYITNSSNWDISYGGKDKEYDTSKYMAHKWVICNNYLIIDTDGDGSLLDETSYPPSTLIELNKNCESFHFVFPLCAQESKYTVFDVIVETINDNKYESAGLHHNGFPMDLCITNREVYDTSNIKRYHNAQIYLTCEVVGRIGNYAQVDSGDYRWRNFFKASLSTMNQMNVPNVNGQKQKRIIIDAVDMYKLNDADAQYDRNKLLHYKYRLDSDYISEMSSYQVFKNMYKMPLLAQYNNIATFKDKAPLAGYINYLELETVGNYSSGDSFVQMLPSYYGETASGDLEPLDAWMKEDGTYVKINDFYNRSEKVINKPIYQSPADEFKEHREPLTYTDPVTGNSGISVTRAVSASANARRTKIWDFTAGKYTDFKAASGSRESSPAFFADGYNNWTGSYNERIFGYRSRMFVGNTNTWTSYGWYGDNKMTGAVIPIHFFTNRQLWYLDSRLPTAYAFVESNKTPTTENMNAVKDKYKRILCITYISVHGPVWDLGYDGEDSWTKLKADYPEMKDPPVWPTDTSPEPGPAPTSTPSSLEDCPVPKYPHTTPENADPNPASYPVMPDPGLRVPSVIPDPSIDPTPDPHDPSPDNHKSLDTPDTDPDPVVPGPNPRIDPITDDPDPTHNAAGDYSVTGTH